MREGRKRMSQKDVVLNEVMRGANAVMRGAPDHVTESLMNNYGSHHHVTFF